MQEQTKHVFKKGNYFHRTSKYCPSFSSWSFSNKVQNSVGLSSYSEIDHSMISWRNLEIFSGMNSMSFGKSFVTQVSS